MVLLLMVSLSSLVVADEAGDDQEEDDAPVQDDEMQDVEEREDNTTEKEIQIMAYPYGAEIRLLQLQNALLKNILRAEMAIDVLQGMEFTTSELEGILDQMNELLETIEEVDPASTDSVQYFVELKHEAIQLTTQFREAVHALINEATKQHLRECIRNATSDTLQNYSQMIQNRIRQFNRNRIHSLYGIIGATNSSLVNDYFNGTLSLYQVKRKLCVMVNQMTQEQKYAFFSEIKEDNIRRQIHAQATMGNLQSHGKGKGSGKP